MFAQKANFYKYLFSQNLDDKTLPKRSRLSKVIVLFFLPAREPLNVSKYSLRSDKRFISISAL